MSRALRAIVTIRKKLNDNVLRKAIVVFCTPASTTAQKNSLLDFLEEVVAFFPFLFVCLKYQLFGHVSYLMHSKLVTNLN
jgi:hypothetical protein